MPAPHPRMHGITHVPGGPDPIPGIARIPGGDTIDAIIEGLDPAGFWKLNESSGTVAADSSGNGLDLSSAVTGGQAPAWAAPAGPPGEPAADFETGTGGLGGTAGRVARNWAAALTGDFTAGIFVNRNNTLFTNVIGQGNPGRSGGTGWQIDIQDPSTGAGNRVSLAAKGIGGVTSDNPLLADTWAFVAAVKNGTTWRLYVNGLEQGTPITGSYTAAASPFPLWIGQDGGLGSNAVFVPQFVGSYAFLIPSALSGADLLNIWETANLSGGDNTGKALLATGLGGTEWDWPTKVDGTRYAEILTGSNLTSTDNGDNTVTIDASGGGGGSFDPATATTWWFPLFDSDGTAVLDGDGNLIPTLIPL